MIPAVKKILAAGLTGARGSGIIPLSPVRRYADLAQLVEQLIRNEQVVGSSPIISSIKKQGFTMWSLFYIYDKDAS